MVALNCGGAICLVEDLHAFLPGSHLAGQNAYGGLGGTSSSTVIFGSQSGKQQVVVSNHCAVIKQQMEGSSCCDVIQGMVKALKP